jgi:hypothetical protein
MMASYAINRVVVIILTVIALAVALVVFTGGLIEPSIPLPEDKERFLRYLSCVYAMCVKGCNSPEVIDIGLDGIKGCNDICNELKEREGCKESVIDNHVCGSGCYLNFTFNKSTTYFANYLTEVRPPLRRWLLMWRMDTDVTKYEKWETIRPYKMSDECFDKWEGTVVLDGREIERGCVIDTIEGWKAGLCEGVLQLSDGCRPENKSGNSIPANRFKEDCKRNTGHIWIDSNLYEQCGPFESENYLGNCTFKGGQTIYIWAELDPPLRTLFGETYCFCPELVICSNPLS